MIRKERDDNRKQYPPVSEDMADAKHSPLIVRGGVWKHRLVDTQTVLQCRRKWLLTKDMYSERSQGGHHLSMLLIQHTDKDSIDAGRHSMTGLCIFAALGFPLDKVSPIAEFLVRVRCRAWPDVF